MGTITRTLPPLRGVMISSPLFWQKEGERVGLNLNRHHFATPSNFPCNIIHINVQKGMCSVHGKLRFETNGPTLISVDIKAFQY